MTILASPKTHMAMVYDQPGKVSIKRISIETPEPGAGQVLVRLTHTGVCHSDHGLMTNAWARYPRPTLAGQIGGHEGVGYVVRLGTGLEGSSIMLGTRVGVKFVHNISGYYTPGTFQEYCLAPANYVTPIPDEVQSHLAAPLLCAGLSAYSALKKARVSPGDWVVVFGAGGGVGHLVCQMAARVFSLRVIGIDFKEKETLVRSCGVETYLALEETKSLVNSVKAETNELGAAAALVCTGEDSAYSQALDMLRFNGVLVVVGVQEGKERPIENACPNAFLFNQSMIVGSSVGNYGEAVEVMNLARRGLIQTHVQVDKLDNLQAVFELMEKQEIRGKVVLEI
ncbi:uncharacterized protein N7487_009274 [Penicillium crustosum]|uniref:uncharacterized protein n=1 Tax=Penicillium crustosum TaxID=36656 RepID=UPI002398F7D9|nr:uncharacterized protein N7487_009274 [Penicillium crustosum]KAJ5394971.1 hypothetical protein N7487_009274 [Penicillium crustosum]